MDSTISFLLSLSIVFAVIIGIVRYRVINASYYPLIYNVCVVLLVEVTGMVLRHSGQKTFFSPLLNCYSIIDFCLFTWLFHNWGLFNRRKDVFAGILIFFIVAWAGLSFFYHGITKPNFFFRILYSFALIFFSVNTFNKVVVHERGNILKNPKFIICLGIIIFYTFFVLVCVSSSIWKDSVTRVFRASLQEINVYSNLVVNILYAVALLWAPRKQNFMTPFSS